MTVDDVLRRAEILQDLGRYQDAEGLVGQVLAEEPDNVDALDTLSRGLSASGRFQESLIWTQRLLSVDPDHIGGVLRLSRALRALGRAREGLSFARRAVELAPDSPACLVSLAVTLNWLTNSAEALAVAEHAVAIDPDYAWGHEVIGMIYLDRAQYADAECATLAALRIDPTNWQSVLQLGAAMAGLGRFNEHRERVQLALRLQPTPDVIDDVIGLIERHGIPDHFVELYLMTLAARGLPDLRKPGAAGTDPERLARQGKLASRLSTASDVPGAVQRAAELADAVLAVDPGNIDALYVRSSWLLRDGQHEQALRIAERLPATEGRYLSLLAHARKATGDRLGALAAIRLLLKESPGDADILQLEAVHLAGLGRYDEALTAVRRSMELKPTAGALNLESFYLGKLGRNDEALAAARRSVELMPTADGLRRETLCLLALGRHDEALAAARRRAELMPTERGVHALLGYAAERAGDLGSAEQAYRTAVADDPRDGSAVGDLALLLARAGRWTEAEAIIAGIPSDITNATPLASSCLSIEAEALRRAERSLARLDLEAPAPEALADLAGWLGICVRMREAAIARDHGVTAPKVDTRLTAIVKTLQPVPATLNSDLARIVRDLGAT